jgi:hypothetical protein
MILIDTDRYDNHSLFNLYLICAEAYQTIDYVDQACYHYEQAQITEKRF